MLAAQFARLHGAAVPDPRDREPDGPGTGFPDLLAFVL